MSPSNMARSRFFSRRSNVTFFPPPSRSMVLPFRMMAKRLKTSVSVCGFQLGVKALTTDSP